MSYDEAPAAALAGELLSARKEREQRLRDVYARWRLREMLPNQYLAWLTTRRYLMSSTSLAIGTVTP